MPLFHLLLSAWLVLLPGFSLAEIPCEEENRSCQEDEAQPEDCCELGEACGCCLSFTLPAMDGLTPLEPPIDKQECLYLANAAVSPTFSVWHPPKA